MSDGPRFELNGQSVTVSAMTGVLPAIIAGQLGVTVAEYLEALEQWANGVALPDGIRVDRERETVTRYR